MHEDPRSFWEDLYTSRGAESSGRPSAVLQRFVPERPIGRALDLGCARGDDAIWLAGRGWSVVGVDIAETALGYARANAKRQGVERHVGFEQHDLGKTFPDGRFDFVSAVFLQAWDFLAFPRHAVLRRAMQAVEPGGRLLIAVHGSVPPWAKHPTDAPPTFPTVEDELRALAIDETEWSPVFVGPLPRTVNGPDGQTAEVTDLLFVFDRRDADVEVAIVGGGPAGHSAALVCGRARRQTAFFDAGAPRNAPAAAAHNLFTRDGTPPGELLRIAHEQLAAYDSVEVHRTQVVHGERLENGLFALVDAHGQRTTARSVLLATGVVDELPDVPGLREAWGTGVHHCPYCHGFEVRDQPLVVLATTPHASHLAPLLLGWSTDVTVCEHTPGLFTDEQREDLQRRGLRLNGPVDHLEVVDGRVTDVVLADGTSLGPSQVFTTAPVRQRSPLPVQLGAVLHEEGPYNGLVEVDAFGNAGVPGLFVIGDAAAGFSQVVFAAAEGTRTAAALNNQLLLDGRPPRGRG